MEKKINGTEIPIAWHGFQAHSQRRKIKCGNYNFEEIQEHFANAVAKDYKDPCKQVADLFYCLLK